MISQIIESLTQRLAAARLSLLQQMKGLEAQAKVLEEKEANVAEIAKVYKDFDTDLNTLATSIDEDLHAVNGLVTGVQQPSTNGTVNGVQQPSTNGTVNGVQNSHANDFVISADRLVDRVKELVPQILARSSSSTYKHGEVLDMLHKLLPNNRRGNDSYMSQCLYQTLKGLVAKRRLKHVGKGQYELLVEPDVLLRNGKRNSSTFIAVRTGEMPSLADCILRVLKAEKQYQLGTRTITDRVKAMGYETTSVNLYNVVSSMLGKLTREKKIRHGDHGYESLS